MYKIILHKKVRKLLDTLEDRVVLAFWDKIKHLKENPFDKERNIDIVPFKDGEIQVFI
ncbi:MAG: hypothetical protein GY928_27430 [Colwellia sp.]|nr:hypothetical protein [Colwellia sp.]